MYFIYVNMIYLAYIVWKRGKGTFSWLADSITDASSNRKRSRDVTNIVNMAANLPMGNL